MIDYLNNKPLSFNEMLKHEKEVYKKQSIKEGIIEEKIDVNSILARESVNFKDRIFNMPQNLFFVDIWGFPTIVWRKILSELYIDWKINALNCSQVSDSMLLGFLVSKKKWDILSIEYNPFTNWEKITIFKKLVKDKITNIHYPYQYLDFETNSEKVCSTEWWKFNPEKATYLGNWEKHFRKFTNSYFKNLINDWDIVFDPACSTWEFLNSFKKKFPQCRTIWQDLSVEMTEYAKNFVDEIYTGNSLNSPLSDRYVKVMFLRFLNSEIVTKEDSYILFDSLEKKVKKGGYMVIFWHTPVLLKKEYFLESGKFELLNSTWYNPINNTIFQYYVLKKLVN